MADLSNRRFVRRAVAVEFKAKDATQAHPNDEIGELLFDTMDVSEGGAFLRSELLLELGETLEVAFTLPSGHKVQTTAKVVWVTHKRDIKGETGMALEFLNLDDASRQAILAFVKTEEP